jgi:hypothetical protein
MTLDRVDQTTVTEQPTAAGGQQVVRTNRSMSTSTASGSEMARRIVALLFGLIQIFIGARIVLLLLDARTANDIVASILNVSQLFVAPFEGILRTDSLHAAGSVLDVTAVVALVGWTVLELIVIWAVGIFRREPAV